MRALSLTDAPFELSLVNAAIGPKQVVETLRGEVGLSETERERK